MGNKIEARVWCVTGCHRVHPPPSHPLNPKILTPYLLICMFIADPNDFYRYKLNKIVALLHY